MATIPAIRPSNLLPTPTVRLPAPDAGPVEFSLPPRSGNRRGAADSWGDPLQASGIPLLPEGSIDPELQSRLELSQSAMPEVGGSFRGFHLLAELGRGAFGRVFLARQTELADRLVALKISTESLTESQKLAQLQHTHIVPIYSFHQDGPVQAVCMPFLGSTTLADVLFDLQQKQSMPVSGKGLVSTLHERKSQTARTLDSLRSSGSLPAVLTLPQAEAVPHLAAHKKAAQALQHLEGLTYVEAVLWLGIRLADGLSHAHERGIIHRDLKPANILLTDEGQPLLLDFNLAEDIKLQGALAAMLGGTLPYMSPEHLEAFLGETQPVDARSDLYALGLILIELLLGRHPFPRIPGPPEQALQAMIAARRQAPPRLRAGNPAISPAVEAILRKCLEPNPADRYQSAQELKEDLERQLDHRPLKHAPEPSLVERVQKFSRRHPVLTSGTTIGTVSAVVIALLVCSLVGWWRHANALADAARFRTLQDETAAARLYLGLPTSQSELRAEGAAKARRAIAPFLTLDCDEPLQLPAGKEEATRALLAEALLILAGTESDPEAALAANARAATLYGDAVPRGVYLQRALLLADRDREEERATALAQAEASPVRDTWESFFRAQEHLRRNDLTQAIAELKDATERDTRNFTAWYQLGCCYLEGATHKLAEKTDPVIAFTRCVELNRAVPLVWVQRGLAHVQLKQYQLARDDFSEAIALAPESGVAYLHRALVNEALQKYEAALSDANDAVRLAPRTPRALVVRGRLRGVLGDAAGSQQDQAEVRALEPTDEEGFLSRGIARLKTAPVQALADFKEAIARNPRSLAGHVNQAGVLASFLNRPQEAVAVLDTVLRLYPARARAYADRGILQAYLGKREAAHADATAALRACDRKDGDTLYQVAGIYMLTNDRTQTLSLLAEALSLGYGLDRIERDPTFKGLWNDPAFKELVGYVRALKLRARQL